MFVIASISNGTIMKDKVNEKIKSRPLNFKRLNANAARIVVNVVQITQDTVTIIEFKKYF